MPAIRFILLGALLFALVRLIGSDPAPSQTPAWTAESLLVEAAIAHGLDERDPVVRKRLVDNLRFAGERGDDSALVAMAKRLDMPRHDPVVRRRLATRMRMLRPAAVLAATDLAGWYATHGERFRTPSRRVFTQVLTPDVQRLGQPQRLPRRVSRSQQRLRSELGRSFSEAVFSGPVGHWAGPFESSIGWHLVFVHEAVAGEIPPLERVRPAAAAQRRLEQSAQHAQRTLMALSKHFGVTRAGGDP